MKKLHLFFIVFLSLASCHKSGIVNNTGENTNSQKITYQESNEDFSNPERGFYRYASTNTSNFVPLDSNILISYREGATIPGTQYRFYCSLVYRNYNLDNFKTVPLSQDFLNEMNEDFAIARAAGVKLIVRFSYIDSTHSGGCPVSSICPPYGDAPLSVVLEQISQLKPYLQQNADVIACVQEGFIGVWGEGFYSDYFGDASPNGNGKLLDSNWVDRNEVLKALLNAVPQSRMIQVRYPQIKQRYIYGVSAPISSAALTPSQAYNGSDIARIGFHDDCFLADATDQGTFIDYGNSNSPPNSNAGTIATMTNYMAADSKYVPVGGESCTNSLISQCDPAGSAETEMAEFHYSFLNAEYNLGVIGNWASGGCLNTIKMNLGYRFVLTDATFPIQSHPGGAFILNLDLNNVGFAAPFNQRPLQLILRDSLTSQIVVLPMPNDIRTWYSGAITINDSLNLPVNIPTGTYQLLLNLPDQYNSISNRPEYSIRFANTNMWEDLTGYNNLNCSVIVK